MRASRRAALLSGTAVSKILNDNDWATIRKVSDSGLGANYWSVGDAKQITISGTIGTLAVSQTIWVFILGFNHNSAREGTNRIHFQIGRTAQTYSNANGIAFVDSAYATHKSSSSYFVMNPSTTDGSSAGASNSGGWNSCKMRTVILGSNGTPTSPTSSTFLSALPSDLRAVMKSCTKYSDNTGGGSNTASYVTSTTDYLFLLSEWEVFGIRTNANSAEQNYQVQYNYYANGNSKIRYRHSATSSTAMWFLRSVVATVATTFCIVNASGAASNQFSSYALGVAPGFCV